MATLKDLSGLKELGDYIREQRSSSQISLRQLAAMAGVSNPYLSQIERGLRKPSADILAQIAKGLSVSAEAMYVQAGILDERAGDPHVSAAILGDQGLTDRQKHVLLEIYDSFAAENDERRASAPQHAAPAAPAAPAAEVPVVATEPPSAPAAATTKATNAAKKATKASATKAGGPRNAAAKKAASTSKRPAKKATKKAVSKKAATKATSTDA